MEAAKVEKLLHRVFWIAMAAMFFEIILAIIFNDQFCEFGTPEYLPFLLIFLFTMAVGCTANYLYGRLIAHKTRCKSSANHDQSN